ncbi:MAG TPA: ABC transporter permease subunit [Actinomycetes bacterium]|jgi:NitT/TauT family transport system permease protein|nr:ABC transporter permease subunit [Actinomycetes bacterium]
MAQAPGVREATRAPAGRPRDAAAAGARRLLHALRSPWVARLLSLALFVLGWYVLVPLLPTVLLPSPTRVAQFMWDELRGDTLAPQTVYEAFAVSLQRLGLGFLLALAVGVPIGLLVGLRRDVAAFLHDFVVVGLAVPSLLWALITAMWFGYGSVAPIVTVLLAATPFVVINVAEGVRDAPKELLDAARAYEVPRARAVRHVVLPSLMPFFFASMRYGIANGWKGLVLAEVFAATNGAGWTIRYWYDAHRAHGVIGYALFFLIFALLLERVVFGRLSAWVFRWRPAVTQDRRWRQGRRQRQRGTNGADQG